MKRVCFFTQGHVDFDLIKGLKSTKDYELKNVIFPDVVKPTYNRIVDAMVVGTESLSCICDDNDIFIFSSRVKSFYPDFEAIKKELLSRGKKIIEIPESTYKNKNIIYKPIVLINALGSRLSQVGMLMNLKRQLEDNIGEVSLFSNNSGLLCLGEAKRFESSQEINESSSKVCLIHTERGLINPFCSDGYDDEINGILFDSKVDYVVTIVPFNLAKKEKEYKYRELFKGRYGLDIDFYCVDKVWYDLFSGNMNEIRPIRLSDNIADKRINDHEDVLLMTDDYVEVANSIFEGIIDKLAAKTDYRII